MKSLSLERIRRDVETMQQAIGADLPFGPADMLMNVALIPSGLIMTVYGSLFPLSLKMTLLVLIPIAIVGIVNVLFFYRAQNDPKIGPSRKREYRTSLLLGFILIPFVVLYIFWEKRIGVPRNFVGAASVLFVAIALLALALCDRRKRYYLGAAVPLIVFGLAIPTCSSKSIAILGGICTAAAGLFTSLIQWQQFRQYQAHRNTPAI